MKLYNKIKVGSLCLAIISASNNVEDIPVIIVGDESYIKHKVYKCLFPDLTFMGIHEKLLKNITVN